MIRFHGIPEAERGYTGKPEEYHYDRTKFGRGALKMGLPDFVILLKPRAYAETVKGIAIANPISNLVIARNHTGSIVHQPQATAVAGPGGIAHALSELNLYEYVKA